jgi:hypothetical protein
LFGRIEEKKSTIVEGDNSPTTPLVKKEKIRLIEGDRGRNIEIILTKLRTPISDLVQTLKVCQGKHCNHVTLDNMMSMMPTTE